MIFSSSNSFCCRAMLHQHFFRFVQTVISTGNGVSLLTILHPSVMVIKFSICIFCDNAENITDIVFHLNNKEKCSFNNKIANINTPCFICDPENLIGVVCINNFQLNSKDISICVHELIHLMIYISNISGCEINLNTSECWAYFIGSMTQMMIEIL